MRTALASLAVVAGVVMAVLGLRGSVRAEETAEFVEFAVAVGDDVVLVEVLTTDPAGAKAAVLAEMGGVEVQAWTAWGSTREGVNGVWYNPAGKPDGLEGDEAEVVAAMEAWNGITPNFGYEYRGRTDAMRTACDQRFDGRNTVVWGVRPSTILATTCSGKGSEFDVVINADKEWGVVYELLSTMLHEFGHGAGLGHSQHQNAVMWWKYNGLTKLTGDEIAGLCARYGGCPGETPTPTSPPPVTQVVVPSTATPTATATETPSPTPEPEPAATFRAFAPLVARD